MTRLLLAFALVLAGCDHTVSVVLERVPVCDPDCHLPELSENGERELIVYRATAATVCDETLVRRAGALDASDSDRVVVQSFRGARGEPLGEMNPGVYAFVALVRSAAESCPVEWWGCEVVSLDDDVSEIEIEIEEHAGSTAIIGCGSDRACVPAEGRCE